MAEEEETPTISQQLAEFLSESGFNDKLMDFLTENVSNLTIAGTDEEQSLEVYEAYKKFEALFDGEFSEFMEKIGVQSLEEMSECLKAEQSEDDQVSLWPFRASLGSNS
mmetsp:Transcript_6441/g.10173  ORF Transcript_6441/g.10173 Transcript_6441/m.10173 type:complete len:109 (-) Transcript_6441:536-862(-)